MSTCIYTVYDLQLANMLYNTTTVSNSITFWEALQQRKWTHEWRDQFDNSSQTASPSFHVSASWPI